MAHFTSPHFIVLFYGSDIVLVFIFIGFVCCVAPLLFTFYLII